MRTPVEYGFLQLALKRAVIISTTAFVICAEASHVESKSSTALQISPAAAKECDRAVADGMKLFSQANTSFETRKGTSAPMTDAEKEFLQRRSEVEDKIGEACFISVGFRQSDGADPVRQLMAESHWQLAQERYALQIEYLMQSTALDITQDSLAKMRVSN